MDRKKREQRTRLYRRLDNAMADIYHNATPDYLDLANDFEAHHFQQWFEQAAADEIEYINGGGAYGDGDYMQGARANFMQNRPTFEWKKETPEMLYTRCRMYQRQKDRERMKYARHEWIRTWGTLYQYGRGGRTVAPEYLMKRFGCNDHVREFYPSWEELNDSLNYEDAVELVMIVEAFNAYVKRWNSKENLEFMWKDHKEANGPTEDEIEAHEGMTPHYSTVINWR